MRIAHVVTYISDANEYGGPVSVALAQARALVADGHEVTIFASSPVADVVEKEVGRVKIKLYPVRWLRPSLGFAGANARGLTRAILAERDRIDVLHIHLARDLVTLPVAWVARRTGLPYVLQTHGMVDRSDRRLARLLDLLATRRVLRSARQVFTLTPEEERELKAIEPRVRLTRVYNVASVGKAPSLEGRSKLVLFVARLHPRKRVLAFIRMAEILGANMPDARFVIVGPDEGDGGRVTAAIETSVLGGKITWEGALPRSEVDSLMQRASVYVLPSVGEVFPMTVLEAFAEGTPVVANETIGIAQMCREYGAALLTTDSPADLAAAVTSVLDSSTLAESLREGGLRLLRDRLDPTELSGQLVKSYGEDGDA